VKAAVCTRYGPPEVLQLREVRRPVPQDDEVLVRIRATTVGAADCELRRFDFAPSIWLPVRLAFGIRRPRQPVLGQELAGEVESVGSEVGSLSPVIDRRFPLERMADAHRYAESGQKQGNIVVVVT